MSTSEKQSIDRGRMFKILIAYGILKPLVNMISITYENTEAKLLTPAGETNSFHINLAYFKETH